MRFRNSRKAQVATVAFLATPGANGQKQATTLEQSISGAQIGEESTSGFADVYEGPYGQSVNGPEVYDIEPVVPETTTTQAHNAPVTSAPAIPQGPTTVDVNTIPIMGKPVLSGKQLADWFKSYTKQPYSLEGIISIEDLANLFIEEGNAEGVRGDIAFAQAILETGWFSYPKNGQVKRTDNNYAGIGAFNGTPNGFKFESPRLGVRAQIQLLKGRTSCL